ncbi:MAG: O-antigen ligase family protein [Rhodospirillales bacterium]|nr:O-antigen ligase family protein [Rhodospirillales bacterium]
MSFFASKGLAPLFVIAAVFALAAEYFQTRSLPSLPRPFTALLSLVVLWGLASSLWSITPYDSAYLTLPLGATFLGGLVLVALAKDLRSHERDFFEAALISGVGFGFALLAFEVLTPLLLTGILFKIRYGVELKLNYTSDNFFKTAIVVLALMTWPVLNIFWKRKRFVVCMLISISVLLLMYRSGALAAFAGFAIGLASVGGVWAIRQNAKIIYSILIGLAVLTAPLIPPLMPDTKTLSEMAPNLPDAIFPRVFIWHNASRIIAEHPVLGTGLDTARAISSAAQKYPFYGQLGSHRQSEAIPLHTHNGVLQIWLELGALGAVLLAIFLVMLIRRIGLAANRPDRAVGYGVFFTGLTIASVSYGIWQSWWLGTLWMTAAFTAASLSGETDTDP